MRYFRLLAFLSVAIGQSVAPADDSDNPKSTITPTTVTELNKEARKSIVVISVNSRDGSKGGMGTGFVISDDGLIATNLHVIGQSRAFRMETADGMRLPVIGVHASDRGFDLAIVRVQANGLQPLEIAKSEELRQGQRVIAIGNPHGLRHSVVEGVVSGLPQVEGREMIQLAIPIEPGNSGGPVINDSGAVVGIVTMKSAVTSNLGFAVKTENLLALLDRPNPVPMRHWLTLGSLDKSEWTPTSGARWRRQSGHIKVSGKGDFFGRALCLAKKELPDLPCELAVTVRLDDESGAAGLVFHSDGKDRHYGFYPSAGRLRLSRFDGPSVYQWNVLHEVASSHYRPGDWNELKVRIQKDKLLCYVNGQLVIESNDKIYKTGKVGLAKFRQTQADFKDFGLDKTIPTRQVTADELTRIVDELDNLPPRKTWKEDDLSRLAREADIRKRAFRRKAKKLEEEATLLRRIADEAHVASVIADLSGVLSPEQGDVDLAHAALLVSKLDNEDLSVRPYLATLDRMGREIRELAGLDASEEERFGALINYLFAERGYHGSRTEYYHRANSYLDRVIDDREGLPITLSVLFMELGRRNELTIEGVGLPGHFVVRFVHDKGEPQLIDVFMSGKAMSREDAAAKVRELGGTTLAEEHLRANTPRQIVVRMLNNLLNLAHSTNDRPAALRYLEAIVAISPDDAMVRGMRGVARFDAGLQHAALEDMDWILKNETNESTLRKVRQIRAMFERSIEEGDD